MIRMQQFHITSTLFFQQSLIGRIPCSYPKFPQWLLQRTSPQITSRFKKEEWQDKVHTFQRFHTKSGQFLRNVIYGRSPIRSPPCRKLFSELYILHCTAHIMVAISRKRRCQINTTDCPGKRIFHTGEDDQESAACALVALH